MPKRNLLLEIMKTITAVITGLRIQTFKQPVRAGFRGAVYVHAHTWNELIWSGHRAPNDYLAALGCHSSYLSVAL